jgi:hypothetical protein
MLDPEAAILRHALRTADRPGVGRAYPKTLRQRVVTYARRAQAAGRPRADVADALGLSLATLARWAQPAAPAAPAFRPVVVAPEPAQADASCGVAVVLPGGVRVEGLSVEQAAELCRRLR